MIRSSRAIQDIARVPSLAIKTGIYGPLRYLKSFKRNPAFVVDIVQHINWFKQYFELEFTLHEKNGKARFNLFNEDGF